MIASSCNTSTTLYVIEQLFMSEALYVSEMPTHHIKMNVGRSHKIKTCLSSTHSNNTISLFYD